MIIQATKVIGHKVISLEQGEELERVDDILYSSDTHTVQGVLVKPKGIMSNAKVILLSEIQSIGTDAVMVQTKDTVKSAKDASEEIKTVANSKHFLTQTKIVTEEGVELGSITDIFFDSQTGIVQEFEVTQGKIEDVKSGRKRIRPTDIITVGKDATLVRGFTEVTLEQQAQQGGIQGALNQAKQTVEEKAPEVKEKVQDTVETAKDKTEQKAQEIKTDPRTQQFVHDAKENVYEAQQQMGALGGKAVAATSIHIPRGTDVKLPDGSEFVVNTEAEMKKK
jgi:uncharacterized protein YrrD